MTETFFLFSLIHLWCPILIQTQAACPPACSTSAAAQCQRPLGQNLSLLEVVGLCNLWEVEIRHLCGFLLLFWGFSWFPVCWEYRAAFCFHVENIGDCSFWRRMMRNRRWWVLRWSCHPHGQAEVRAWFVALTFLSQESGEMAGSLCSSSTFAKRLFCPKVQLQVLTESCYNTAF